MRRTWERRKEKCALECWEECLCLVKIVGNSRNLSIYVYNFRSIFLSFLSTYIPLVLKVVFQTSKVENPLLEAWNDCPPQGSDVKSEVIKQQLSGMDGMDGLQGFPPANVMGT